MSTQQLPEKKEAEPAPSERPELSDRPPLLGSWRNIYLLVAASLAFFVALLWVISRIYA